MQSLKSNRMLSSTVIVDSSNLQRNMKNENPNQSQIMRNLEDLQNSYSYSKRIDEEDEKSNSPVRKARAEIRKVESNP